MNDHLLVNLFVHILERIYSYLKLNEFPLKGNTFTNLLFHLYEICKSYKMSFVLICRKLSMTKHHTPSCLDQINVALIIRYVFCGNDLIACWRFAYYYFSCKMCFFSTIIQYWNLWHEFCFFVAYFFPFNDTG